MHCCNVFLPLKMAAAPVYVYLLCNVFTELVLCRTTPGWFQDAHYMYSPGVDVGVPGLLEAGGVVSLFRKYFLRWGSEREW